jgi:HEAT repeat protein
VIGKVIHMNLQAAAIDHQSLQANWQNPAIPAGADRFTYYSDLGFQLVASGQAGIDFLQQNLTTADSTQLAALLASLPLHSPELPTNKTYQYLNHADPLVVGNTIERLRLENAIECLPAVLALKSHADPYVRNCVLRFVAKLQPEQSIDLLLTALNDESHLVRMSAIDELDEIPYPEALPQIYACLNDGHPHVQAAAQQAIAHLNSAAQ